MSCCWSKEIGVERPRMGSDGSLLKMLALVRNVLWGTTMVPPAAVDIVVAAGGMVVDAVAAAAVVVDVGGSTVVAAAALAVTMEPFE